MYYDHAGVGTILFLTLFNRICLKKSLRQLLMKLLTAYTIFGYFSRDQLFDLSKED